MLNSTNKLNSEQLEKLDQLCALCKKKDGSIPNVYTHLLQQVRAFPANILWEEQQLLGFLGAYFFYEEAVEISLLIHPDYRRRKMATELMHAILPLIQSLHYKQLIFSSPAQRNNKWLLKQGYSYLHSEYHMGREDLTPLLGYQQALIFRDAQVEDIPFLCALDKACFKEALESEERFQNLLETKDYQILLAYHNKQPVGKAHLRWTKKGATLSDIAVLPAKQGRGLGTLLITHCINFALSQGKNQLNLDVETHNERALALYTRLGFLIKNACDYWKIDLSKFLSTYIR